MYDRYLGVLLRDGDLGSVYELEERGEGVGVEVLQHDLRVFRLNETGLEHPENIHLLMFLITPKSFVKIGSQHNWLGAIIETCQNMDLKHKERLDAPGISFLQRPTRCR